jgi:MoxR-like ATPase
MSTNESTWPIFLGTGEPHPCVLPEPPPWRIFSGEPEERALPPAPARPPLLLETEEIELINAAMVLRRPLLVTGKPGLGKSSLAHVIARELDLGPALVWPINTRSALQDGLYRYDALGRLQEKAGLEAIGKYIRLGPLGTALLPSKRPRVLLIDEIDKSDLDFPNDLLNVFEDGWFEIPELARLPDADMGVGVRPSDDGAPAVIRRGRVTCREFPIVVMTNNEERDFPPPFLRRCIRLDMVAADDKKLKRIVEAHFGPPQDEEREPLAALINHFLEQSKTAERATDQLLNAVYLLIKQRVDERSPDAERLRNALLRELK